MIFQWSQLFLNTSVNMWLELFQLVFHRLKHGEKVRLHTVWWRRWKCEDSGKSNHADQDNGDDDEESDGGVGVEWFQDSGDDGKIGSDSPGGDSTIQHCCLSLQRNTMCDRMPENTTQCTSVFTVHCSRRPDVAVNKSDVKTIDDKSTLRAVQCIVEG